MAFGRKTGGRRRGTPNKSTADIRAIAQCYGESAIQSLAQLAGLIPNQPAAAAEQVRVQALRELLDRGYGKATTLIGSDETAAPLAIDFRWADAAPETTTSASDAPANATAG